jgi:cytochrome P450 PksS
MLRITFTSQDYLRNPSRTLQRLRAAGPLVAIRFPIIGKTWITTNSELAAHVLKNNQTFPMRFHARLPACAGGCRVRCARSPSAC